MTKAKTKKKTKRVTIISRESDKKTRDIRMLEAELLSRGIDVRVLSRLLTKEKSIRTLGYTGHIVKQEAAILASDVVVLDTYCIPASMLPHRRGTKIVQMWHALSAIKKFGWQTVGREGGSSPRTAKIMRMHHGYDYVISPSDITAKHFCEAFRVSPDKIVKQGLPRVDYIKSVSRGDLHEETAERIYARYPQLRQAAKKVILYAPTFRKGKTVDVQSLIDAVDTDRFCLIVKLHPLYRGDLSEADKTRDPSVIYDEKFTSSDWLSVCDIIISDYSSFVVESTLAGKPLYIYAYDREEYAGTTGLNVEYQDEPIAPYVFSDAKELGKAIEKACDAEDAGSADGAYDMEALHAFRDRYIDIDTDNCTAKLADFIEGLI